MAEIFYPERLKCKRCRKKLGTTVLDGLYCSYLCSNTPQPSSDISKAPRHCKREINGVWGWKTKYRAEIEVPEKLRKDPATNVYLCDYCHFKHVGHSRVKVEDLQKLRRVVHDENVLGSVLKRRREQLGWDKARLAKDLKVPLFKITEVENGDPKMDVKVLFKVMNRLKLTVEIIER